MFDDGHRTFAAVAMTWLLVSGWWVVFNVRRVFGGRLRMGQEASEIVRAALRLEDGVAVAKKLAPAQQRPLPINVIVFPDKRSKGAA